MAISKAQRFEVFKRDGFTCQYCGQRPPDVVLEVDHVHPQSKGGTDDLVNLVTACSDCNRGKRAKVLTDRAPRPDADMEFLAIQQEMVELRRFLAAKEARDHIISEAVIALMHLWETSITGWSLPTEQQFRLWLMHNSADEIAEAITCTGPKVHGYYLSDRSKVGIVKYVAGTLRKMRERRNGDSEDE